MHVWWASKQLSSLQWYVVWTLNYDFWIIWHRSGVMLIRRMIFFVFVENNPKKSSHIQDQPSIKSKHLVNGLHWHTYKYENWEINLWWPFCTCLPFGKCYFVCHRSHRHTQLIKDQNASTFNKLEPKWINWWQTDKPELVQFVYISCCSCNIWFVIFCFSCGMSINAKGKQFGTPPVYSLQGSANSG